MQWSREGGGFSGALLSLAQEIQRKSAPGLTLGFRAWLFLVHFWGLFFFFFFPVWDPLLVTWPSLSTLFKLDSGAPDLPFQLSAHSLNTGPSP